MTQDTLVTLTALAPLPPILAFAIIALFTNRHRALSAWLAVGMMFISLLMSWTVVFNVIGRSDLAANPLHGSIAWIPTGDTTLNMGVSVDPLGALFLFMVPLACTLIILYSVGYMSHETRYTRFFAYLSLFAGSMMGLVVSDNLLSLFIFWELMGFCSYSLIGFFYYKPSAYKAAVKAFMTTRVGDMFLILGMVYLYTQTGSLNFHDILLDHHVLEALAETPALLIPGLSAAGLAGLLIFGGTVGKSAQWPLHVWLPDAMEGPTPVSAMIHAATMVSAGIFMLLRFFNLFAISLEAGQSAPLMVVSLIGAITAFMGATIALAQYDIKRVLAYSTISQLGFMVAAIGIGAYVAAAFHLLTHAFFKALLFLGSGSVIHGVEHVTGHHAHGDPARAGLDDGHGHGHDTHATEDGSRKTEDLHGHGPSPVSSHPSHQEEFDPQDMRNMGGLRTKMPITFITFLLGGLALMGFPFVTAGFWSKDEIFAEAFHFGFDKGQPLAALVFVVLVLSALMTAFYTTRQIKLTFFGAPRTDAAAHASENTWHMTVPLMVLSFFAIFAGFINVPKDFLGFGGIFSGLNIAGWLNNFITPMLIVKEEPLAFNIVPVLFSLAVALGGLALGWVVYSGRNLKAGVADPVEKLGGLYTFLNRRWMWDELYRAVIINPLQAFADNYTRVVDKGIIDKILEGGFAIGSLIADGFKSFDRIFITGFSDTVGRIFKWLGNFLRDLQTGQVQGYLLSAMIAVLVLVGFFLFFVVR
jgi:NADH-quinone oxidoreductase subunit L